MKPPEDSHVELLRYLDGSLDREETKALAARLAEDAALRSELREIAEQAISLGDIGRAEAVVSGAVTPIAEGKGVAAQVARVPGRSSWLAAAAAVAFGLATLLWSVAHRASSSPSIASIEFTDGAVRWTDRDGRIVESPASGTKLGAGSLSVESSGGSAQIRFPDATVLTLGGETEVHLSQREGRKQLVLDRGVLTAEVSKQPDRSPLTVITASAEIEVLGTILSVSADASETSLAVDEGLVALRRLSDGERIEVPAGQRVVASLDPREPMAPVEEAALPDTWQLDLDDREVNRVTKGQRTVIANRDCLEAEAYVAARRKDGSPLIRHGVAINSAIRMGVPFVSVEEDSYVRIRYRVDESVDRGPEVFLGIARRKGGFGGNFSVKLDRENRVPDADGWYEARIPITEFELLENLRERERTSGRSYGLIGNDLKKVLISVSDSQQVQVAEVEVGVGS